MTVDTQRKNHIFSTTDECIKCIFCFTRFSQGSGNETNGCFSLEKVSLGTLFRHITPLDKREFRIISKRLGGNPNMVYARIYYKGWDIIRAITTPVKNKTYEQND